MAYSVDIYDINGKVVGEEKLNESLFSDDLVNQSLIHEFYLLQAANWRQNLAKVKWRWEVRVSWKKLYKQKWTWNARSGWKDSPTRKWGWVAFGPRWERNFAKWMNTKQRRLALQWLLTLKAKSKDIVWLKSFELKEPKTKKANEIISNLWLNNSKVLFVISQKDENICKSFRNLEKVKYLLVDYLNPYDIMTCDKMLINESALAKINTIKE